MGLDCLFRVDGLVADCHINVPVADDDLRYMRREPVHDGIRDKEPPEIMGGIAQGAAVGRVGEAGVAEARRRAYPGQRQG